MEGLRVTETTEGNVPLGAETPQEEQLWNRILELSKKEGERVLSDEEFAELIRCEETLFLYDNPPIESVFDPKKELSRVQRLPREEQKIALELFKDKLVRQRHAYAECRMLLEKSILRDPDVSTDGLEQISAFFASSYGFPGYAFENIGKILREYRQRHANVRALREKFPDDIQLVRALTGVDAAQVTVAESPASIDILTDQETAKRMHRSKGSKDADLQMAGFQSENIMYGVFYTVTAENRPDAPATQTHEREHVKNQIFRGQFDLNDRQFLTILAQEVSETKNPNELRILMEEELTYHRDQALDDAKDEIVAMLKDGVSTYFGRFAAKDGNPYDYLKEAREGLGAQPQYKDAVQKILVTEYERIITDARAAFEGFAAKEEYSRDMLINLLTDMPLESWPNTIRRIRKHIEQHWH